MLFILITLTFVGCGGSTSPDPKPWLKVKVSLTETDTFIAWGFLHDTDGSDLNANITVNGTPVSAIVKTIPGLVGSTVNIIASHPRIGTIQRTYTVPQTATDLHTDTDTDLAKWLSRTDKTLTLYWTGGDGDYYNIGVNGTITSGPNHPWRSSPATISESESNSFLRDNPAELTIFVQGVKEENLSNLGLSFSSEFTVEGLKSTAITYSP